MTDYSLKRHFDSGCARELAVRITPVFPEFDGEGYAREVDAAVGPLELKDRVQVLAEGLRSRLPESYPDAVRVLVGSLGAELKEGEGMFKASWFLMPVARFVEVFGLEYPEVSLDAIGEITRRHTGEYAIRPYLREYPELTMRYSERWAQSESLNVRRLASEGIRPRLPWAPRHRAFVEDPGPVIRVLDHLIDDPSPYVRKSVANNLNDVSKDHPERAVSTAREWLRRSPSERTARLVRHGLRSLIKAGDLAALELVGAAADPSITVRRIVVEPDEVKVGDTLTITAEVANSSPQEKDVVVDYTIHFLGKNGALRPKVFKLKRIAIGPGEVATLRKLHVLKKVNIRTFYPGKQGASVQANGSESATAEFLLEDPEAGDAEGLA